MKNTYIVVDTETTGLDPRKEKVIEIGAVKIAEGEIRDQFDTFVAPERQLSAFITELTGITQGMLADAPSEQDAFSQFLEFAEDGILVGHNLNFDYSFLKYMAVRSGAEFERQGVDTLKLAKAFLPELEKRSLEYLCAHYHIVNAHAHRACDDAMATWKLYQKMKAEFYDESERARKLFTPEQLCYQAKKESPITAAQLRYLKALVEYHHLTLEEDITKLTKNAASRKIDGILSTYGRIL